MVVTDGDVFKENIRIFNQIIITLYPFTEYCTYTKEIGSAAVSVDM